jgi:hypothetical protein
MARRWAWLGKKPHSSGCNAHIGLWGYSFGKGAAGSVIAIENARVNTALLSPSSSQCGLQSDCLRKLELHLGSRANQQGTGGQSAPRLSRRASRLDTICFYRDIASVHRDRRKFES